jgi:hypothetical protein
LTNLGVTADLGLRLIGHFLVKMIPLLIQGIIQISVTFADRDLVGACAEVHAVLAGQARHDDAERMQLAGGKLEAGNGRELVAGHVIGLRRSGAAVKLSGKGWFSGQKRKSVKTTACASGNLVRK